MKRRFCTVVAQTDSPRSLSVEVADSVFRRARGLMGRSSWDGADGMLFVYPWPRVVGIWMRGTHLPLDAVFVDAGGRVVKIAYNMAPQSKHAEFSDGRIKWVLELPVGTCNRMGLTLGDRIDVMATAHPRPLHRRWPWQTLGNMERYRKSQGHKKRDTREFRENGS